MLIAPSYAHNFFDDLEVVETFLKLLKNGIGIVLRLHPKQRNLQKQFYDGVIGRFSKYSNFVFDTSESYFNVYFDKSFALLSDESSMGVSFPFLTLKPSIIYMPNKRKQGVEIEGIHLYDERANIILDNIGYLPEIIDDIFRKKAEYKKNIRIFRESQMYNFMSSSRYIASYVKNKRAVELKKV